MFFFVWIVDFNIFCIKKISLSNIFGLFVNGGLVMVMFKGFIEVIVNGFLVLRVKLIDCNLDGVVEGYKDVLVVEDMIVYDVG